MAQEILTENGTELKISEMPILPISVLADFGSASFPVISTEPDNYRVTGEMIFAAVGAMLAEPGALTSLLNAAFGTTPGQILYCDTGGNWVTLPPGPELSNLQIVNGIPTWA